MTPKNLWWETHNDTQRKSSSESERTDIEYTWAISHSKERSHWIQSAVTDWQEDLQGTWKKMYLHEQINIWANIFLQRKENWMFCYIILLVCYLISPVCGQVFFAIVWFAAWQGRTFLTTTLNPKHLKLYVCLCEFWLPFLLFNEKQHARRHYCFFVCPLNLLTTSSSFFCRPAAGVVQHMWPLTFQLHLVSVRLSLKSQFSWNFWIIFLVLKLPLFRISQRNASLLQHKIYACGSVSERVVVSAFAVKNCIFCIFYKSSLLWCRKNSSTAIVATGLSCTLLYFLS